MTVQQLAQTNSFTIQYEDAFPSAQRRAIALESTVERDAATIFGWFGVANPLNPGNRCTVCVTNNDGNGENWGYQNLWHGTLIEVSPLGGSSDQAIADDFARSIFVAEFVEIVMDVRANDIGHRTWDAGDSAGEALSTICQELLYQDACLRSNQEYPRGHRWIETTDWPDFVSHIDGTDSNWVSFGCGILFISFLMGQRGKTIEEVIQADGTTLEEKFHNLTGHNGGYADMTGILSQFFPKPPPVGALRTDFPFPLLPADQRSLGLNAQCTVSGSAEIGVGQFALTLPFPCHGTTEIDYTVNEDTWHMRLTASPTGFANPSYEWYLIPADGAAPILIDATHWRTTVDWATVVVDLADPVIRPPTQSLPVDVQLLGFAPTTFSVADTQAPAGLLTLEVSGGQGDVSATIECHATDGVAPETTTVTSIAILRCRHVIEADNETLQDCRRRAATLVAKSNIPAFLHPIAPDPPPELLPGIFFIHELAVLAQQAAEKGDKETLALLRSVMTDTFQLPTALFAPVVDRGESAQ